MTMRNDAINAWYFFTHKNPATGETGVQAIMRRLFAVESHMRNLEDRYADMENRFNEHAQGRKHAPAKREVPPDVE